MLRGDVYLYCVACFLPSLSCSMRISPSSTCNIDTSSSVSPLRMVYVYILPNCIGMDGSYEYNKIVQSPWFTSITNNSVKVQFVINFVTSKFPSS